YLEYGGFGIGSPSERQKQYQQFRVYNAVQNASDFMVDKALKQAAADGDNKAIQLRKEQNYFSKKHKLTGMIERVVEELILSSMGSGDFSNLKGSGKPLKQDFSNPYIDDAERRINDILKNNDFSNPYIDDAERRINDILKNNGFAPPWIMKEVEIRVDVEKVRRTLKEEYCRFQVLKNPSYQITQIGKYSQGRWDRIQGEMKSKINQINKQILDYNLTCPIIGRQMVLLFFEKEMETILQFFKENSETSTKFKDEIHDKIEKELKIMKNDENFGIWNFLKGNFTG
uniref:DnaJ homologue subfamily C member 28 conserved domain-containing protein n=1 Tax=Panagrolaimus sp. JU765 TaxID=591449 RepID=A0AC34PVA4_9BILA